MADRIEEFRKRLLSTEGEGTAAGVSRLWKTGRTAASVAAGSLRRRFRANEPGFEALELEAAMRLVEQVGELKGIAMKAGQILGYVDQSLPREMRSLLSVLQTASPASPFVEVERTIRAAFGPRADALLARLERVPVAVASIGQVHRATLPNGVDVAVKVRHAGIEAALASDLNVAGAGSRVAAIVLGAAAASVRSFVDEVRTALMEECDYELEAARQDEFVRLFAFDPEIVIPKVEHDWCGPRVLTTRWMPGQALDAWLETAPEPAARNQLGVALFRFYVGTLYRHGVFHADPHPGNYGLTDGGRVVIYDFGCVRRFDAATVRAFAALVAAVREDERSAMVNALEALGASPPPALNDQLRKLLRGFFGPLLEPGPRRIEPDAGIDARRMLEDKRALMQLALPGKLLFLFRLRFGLYAVLSRIGAEADWAGLESEWAREASELTAGVAGSSNDA